MQFTIPTNHVKASFLMLFISIFFLNTTVCISQTQAPSVQSGVTFQWSDIQPNPNLPATIKSITVDGTVYQSFAVPTTYAMTRVGPNGNNANRIIRNGTFVNNNSSNANWNGDAIAAFQNKNLNHYFLSDSNGRNICGNFGAISTTDSQIQSLYYSPGIPSNAGGLIAISERNANNCYYIALYGTPVGGGPEQFLGDTFVRPNSTQWGPLFNAPPAGVDYWNSGRVLENNGTIGIAIFKLNDLAPTGSIITRFELVAATTDHGDGKAFIIQKYASPINETGCLDNEIQGTLVTNNIPAGSTFTLVSGPTPAGQSFTFNSNGTYSYTPELGFLGDVVFEYQVCLPFPNINTCDTSTATLTYVPWSDPHCNCSSGNADGPFLQN